MKTLLPFLLIVILAACNTVDSEFDPDSVYIRIGNTSPVDFRSVEIRFPNSERKFGPVQSNNVSRYKEFEEAYRYGYIEVKTERDTYVLQPIDYMGESPLRSGMYTFKLDLSEQYVTLETTVD